MDAQELIENEDRPAWPEMSADVSIARSVARAITLDTQRASTDSKVIEIGSQVRSVNTRLIEVERSLADRIRNEQPSATLAAQIDALRAELESTKTQIRELGEIAAAHPPAPATDSGEFVRAFGQINDRVSSVEDAHLRSGDRVDRVMEYLEEAYTRLDALTTVLNGVIEDRSQTPAITPEARAGLDEIGAAIAATSASVGELDSRLHDHIATLDADLTQRLTEADSRVQAATAQLDEARTGLDDARSDLANRFEDAENLINTEISTATLDMAQKVGAAEDHLAAQVAEATLILTESAQRTEASLAEQVSEARTHLADMIEHAIAEAELGAAGGVDESQVRTIIGSEVTDQFADTRTHIDALNGRVEETQGRIDEVHGRVDEAQGRIDETQGRIDEVHGRVDEVHGRLDDAAARQDEATHHVESLSDRVDNAHSRIDDALADDQLGNRIAETVQGSVDDLSHRVDNAHSRVDDAHARIDEAITAHFDSATGRITAIEESSGWIASRLDDSTHALDETDARVTRIDARMEATEAMVDGMGERLAQVADLAEGASQSEPVDTERIEATEHRLDATESRLEQLDQRNDEAQARIDGVGYAIDEIRPAIDELRPAIHDTTARLDEIRPAIDENTARLDEIRPAIDENTTKLVELNDDHHRIVERVSLFEQGIEARIAHEFEGRATDLDGTLGEIRDQAETHDERINSATGNIAANTERLHSIDDRVRQTEDLLTGLDETTAKLSDMQGRIDEVAGSIPDASALIEDRVAPLEGKLDDRLAEFEGSLNDRHAETETKLVGQVEAIHNGLFGHLEGVEQNLAEQVRSVEENLARQVEQIETDLAHQVAEAREVLSDQLVDAEVDLQLKLTKATKTGMFGGADAAEDHARIERLEARIVELTELEERVGDVTSTAISGDAAELQERLATTHEIAVEAQQFAEHLRVLQTDLVQAVQHEMTSQSQRIETLGQTAGAYDDRIERLEATIGSVLALPDSARTVASSAPENTMRISKLEKRLESIDAPADEQRESELREHVDAALAQLHDTLEERSAEVTLLRTELADANTRIAELENGSTTKRSSSTPLTVDAIFGKNTDESDWFDEAYKNKSAGRSTKKDRKGRKKA